MGFTTARLPLAFVNTHTNIPLIIRVYVMILATV